MPENKKVPVSEGLLLMERGKQIMDIIVLAGGLSTERDVSFKTGSMVASALKENGHRVILLDVFMGYSDKEENLDGILTVRMKSA